MDPNIIKAAQNGERTACNRIYHQYKKYWFSICLRYQSGEADAQDVLQNALVKIFTKLYQFKDDRGEFKHWSSRIVTNENLMYLRQKTQTEPLEDYMAEEKYIPPVLDVEKPSAELLTKILQSLPKGYRQVFNLYVLEGYSHIEISEILDISVGASKSQLFKARQMIKKRVTERIQLKAV